MTSFILFGPIHIKTLFIIVLISLLLPGLLNKSLNNNAINKFTIGLAALLISNELFKPFYLTVLGDFKWSNTIPLHLCHISSYATGLYLITKNKKFFDFAYFWGLGGGCMALLTPDIEFGFPHIDFISLFFGHGLLFFGIMYILKIYKPIITFHPLLNAWKYAFLMFPFIYISNLVVTIFADPNYQSNLWYLASPPGGASIMDFFPAIFQNPPMHIVPSIVIGFLVFLFLYLPMYFINRGKS